MGKLLHKVFFDFCIFASLFFIGTHIVPECKMPPAIIPIICLENINLMSSFITAFAKIASTRYSKFAEIFIAYVWKLFCNGIYLLKASNDHRNINNWFSSQSRNRCTPNMVNRNAVIFQYFNNIAPFNCLLAQSVGCVP